MSHFASTGQQRIQDSTITEVARIFQVYLDEAGTESDGFIEGLDITHRQAIVFVNDVLLYTKDGKELSDNQRVVER